MEQRRTRRFQLELPLSITRAGAAPVAVPGFTKNISSTGVLFTSGAAPDLGGPIEYVITLNHEGPQPVNLRCVGKVVRSERAYSNGDDRRDYEVAATLERYEFVRIAS
jgi:PilZ domain